MSTMGCEKFLDQLENWMEGSPHPEAKLHVRDCANCRDLVNDLDSIRTTAHAWAAVELPEPPARIWTSLKNQLEAEGLIRSDEITYGAEKTTGWFGQIFAGLPRPALAGAYLLALIAAGFMLSGPGTQQLADARWMEGSQSATTPVRSQLDAVEHTMTSFRAADPMVTASLHKNLTIVDNYIALCEKSMREEPGNETARDYLYSAYQQKADLLAQMTERGDDGR